VEKEAPKFGLLLYLENRPKFLNMKAKNRQIWSPCRETKKPKLLFGAFVSTYRVARWFVFKPKIPIWANFGGSCYGKSWYILRPFGLFYSLWKYFKAIWYIFCGNLVYF
jgi:hypothetical protein